MSTACRVAISMGDPSGIGPEVTIKALAAKALGRGVRPILVGDLTLYEEAARRLGVAPRFASWTAGDPLPSDRVPVRSVSQLTQRERRPGRPSAAGGRAAYAAIVEATRLVRSGAADVLVTAPVCKANLKAARAAGSGHTELLARLDHAGPVRMIMVGARLRVVLVTTHLALARVPQALTQRGVLDTILLTDATLRERFGIPRPRIAVAGLNPHAGEGGLYGNEESHTIAPAVRQAVRRRVVAVGPLAADSVFPHAAAGRFDAVVCMYHDQGLGPFKLLHFRDGVNFTAGLSFVRTSPDHGTAHDIAGRGVADPASMTAAIRLAVQLHARQRTRRQRAAA